MARLSILLLAVLLVAATGAVVLMPRDPPPLRAGTDLSPPRGLPAFELVDHRGAPFNRQSLAGHWSLVFPGFTQCPDICPTTLAILNRLMAQLDGGAKGMRVVLLTVDPERDSPEALARYLGYFSNEFIGVTGDAGELARLHAALGITAIRIPGAGGDYSVDHSAPLLLIDPEGRLAGYFLPPFEVGALASDLAPRLARIP